MSRFAYIPLDFDNIDLGIERELSINRNTKDLYVLNDFKIPISATNKIRQEIIGNDEIAKKLFNDLDDVEFKYKDYIRKLNNLGYEIDKLIEKTQSDLFNRIDKLDSYKNYLKERYNQFYESYKNIESYLKETLNEYNENINGLLDFLKIKYNNAKDKYNLYIQYEQNYRNTLNKMVEEINSLNIALLLKLNKLGEGTGSYTGQKTVSKTVDGIFIGWFYWLSNNTVTYPGNGGWPRFASSPPDTPSDFVGGIYDLNPQYKWASRTIQYPTEVFSDAVSAVNYFKTGSRLLSIYWISGVEGAGYISHTNLFNQYGKKCAMKYAKSITVKTVEKFSYTVT